MKTHHTFTMLQLHAFSVLTLFVLAFLPASTIAQEIEIGASKDNTLYESADGSLSNGAGSYLFAGTTNSGAVRRGLIMFDVASAVPQGASVEDARLQLTMSRTVSGDEQVSLHRVLGDWGEGASNAAANEGSGGVSAENDATWLHRFFDTDTWQSTGGDFAVIASSSTTVGGNETYSWSATPEMLADIQSWIDTPDENFGWILIGNESTSRSAKRFDSRENATEANRPRLFVTVATNTVTESDDLPAQTELKEAWPNPFAVSTEIGFELGQDSRVSLEVFDVTGRRVADLANGWMPAGRHEVKFRADDLPAGLYMSRLTTTRVDGFHSVSTRTLVLTR